VVQKFVLETARVLERIIRPADKLGGAMRLDGVEIKVSCSRDQTRMAVEKLQLPEPPTPWQIYFVEDANPATMATPLLDLHVVIRARVRPDDDDDVTIKLRPCRASQLPDRWLGDTAKELKVEADWAGDRHVLAASLTEDRRQSLIPAVVAGQRAFAELFTRRQLDFLTDCAGTTINLDALTILPPVTAVRWGKEVTLGPRELGLRAERWTVGGLDFLELSAVVEAGEDTSTVIQEAAIKQANMLAFVDSLGISVPQDQETKTRQVLNYLVASTLRISDG
jgi:hypothetical protein